MPFWKHRAGNRDQIPKIRMFSLMSLPIKYRSKDHCDGCLSRERERNGKRKANGTSIWVLELLLISEHFKKHPPFPELFCSDPTPTYNV